MFINEINTKSSDHLAPGSTQKNQDGFYVVSITPSWDYEPDAISHLLRSLNKQQTPVLAAYPERKDFIMDAFSLTFDPTDIGGYVNKVELVNHVLYLEIKPDGPKATQLIALLEAEVTKTVRIPRVFRFGHRPNVDGIPRYTTGLDNYVFILPE